MKKLTQCVLMLFLILSGAWCYASGAARTGNEKGNDGTPIDVIGKVAYGGLDKGLCIMPTIDGHYLSVFFTENLGQVAIEITADTGSTVSTIAMTTPNGYVFYIALAGDYIVTFTLPNGDVYYGEFTVTD